jgi:ABC-type Na+ transport system ATPase subunit NatA
LCLRFRYADTTCPTAMIPTLRNLTGLSIAEIRRRIAISEPLYEITPFRNDWQEKREMLVAIARGIEDDSMPLIVTEKTNGVDTLVSLDMLKNIIQHFRQIELQIEIETMLKNGEINDPDEFISTEPDWTQ